MRTLSHIFLFLSICFCTINVQSQKQLPPYVLKNVFNTPLNELKSDTLYLDEKEIEKNLENATLINDIIKTAKKYIGAKYRHAHSGPKTFDCSGFTSFVYRQYDIELSRSCKHQYNEGYPINKRSDLQIGDLVFFGSRRNPKRIGHVGIVTDVDPKTNKFKFIHASVNGVRISPSDEKYYLNRYIGARRIIKN